MQMYSLSTSNNNRFYEAAKLKVDPLSDKYPSLSPYAYCNNNPIRITDPNGMEVDDPESIYGGYKSEVTSIRDSYNKKINTLNDRRNQRIAEGKGTNFLDSKIKNQERKRDIYQGILNECDVLEKSDQIYTVSSTSKNEKGVGGKTSYNTSTNNVEIKLSKGFATSDVAHEFKHAFQFENQELSFDKSGNFGGWMYDVYDEKAAFDRGALFGGAFKTLGDIRQLYPTVGKDNVTIKTLGAIENMKARNNIYRQK